MSYKFNIVIEKEDDWYIAYCLENKVASQGKTEEEAKANLKEALELFYEDEAQPIMPKIIITTLEAVI